MAYCSTSGLADNTMHFLTIIKNFLVTTGGWTLVMDNTGGSPSTPTVALKSNGENGKEDVYISFNRPNPANAKLVACVHNYHDGISAPVTIGNYSYTYVGAVDGGTFLYWIFSSLDRVVLVTKIGTSYNPIYAGLYKRFWSDKYAVTLAPVMQGTNPVIPVDDASIFAPDTRYILRDNTGFEKALISAIDVNANPDTITIASLTRAFGTGAKIGEDPQPLCVSQSNALSYFSTLYRCDGTVPTDLGSAYGAGGKCEAWNTGVGASQMEKRYSKATLWPIMFSQRDTTLQDIKGELIETYSISSDIGASEDIIQMGSVTYKIFQCVVFNSGGVYMAVRAS